MTLWAAEHPYQENISVEVTETVGNKVANSLINAVPACDGVERTTALTGIADGTPFKVGTAFVRGSFVVSESSGSTSAPFSGDVRLKKQN